MTRREHHLVSGGHEEPRGFGWLFGPPDEVGNVAALLMGSDGEFITGSDFLIDGGVTAAYWFGELAPQ